MRGFGFETPHLLTSLRSFFLIYTFVTFSDLQSGQIDDLSLVLLYTFPQSLHRYLNHLSSSIIRFMGPPPEHIPHRLLYTSPYLR